MIVNIHAAKTNLSKLIEKAEAGEEVVIARNGKPAVKLTPVDAAKAAKQAPAAEIEGRLPSWFGSMRGEIWMADDFDSVNEEIGRLMEEGDIFPREDGKD
jgi:prevent-host-death family protein